MIRTTMVRLMLAVAAIAVAVFPVPAAEAQGLTQVRPGGRGGTVDVYLPLSYVESATIAGQNGSSADLNADWGFGFGVGYNINDYFQINGMFNWAYRSYDATVVKSDGTTQRYSNYMDTSTLSVNGVYYVLNGDITPFISGGVGVTYVDTNIQNGPSSGTCWYDPWWGYVCSSYVPTKTENDITYNAGIGVRFDMSRGFGMQAGYYKTWIDFSKSSGTPDFDIWRIDFIFRM
jgi:opacity protein-like surface antigen